MNNIMGKDWPEELGDKDCKDSIGIAEQVKIPEVPKKETVFDEVDMYFPDKSHESDY